MKFLKLSASGKCLPHPSTSTTRNSQELQEGIGKKTKRKATTHQEILRVEEEDGKEEAEETGEVATTPTAVAEVEANMVMTLIEETESIKSGMTTKVTEVEREIIRVITLRSMSMKKRKETMKIRREPEVLLEGIDPVEKIETIRDNIEEIKALIEGNRHLKGGADGITALIGEGKGARGITLLM